MFPVFLGIIQAAATVFNAILGITLRSLILLCAPSAHQVCFIAEFCMVIFVQEHSLQIRDQVDAIVAQQEIIL